MEASPDTSISYDQSQSSSDIGGTRCISSRPILYGHLFNDYEKGLGRQGGLPAAFSMRTPVILLTRSGLKGEGRFSLKPSLERVGANLILVRNAFSLRCSRIGRRLGPMAGWFDGAWLNDALDEAGLGDYIYWLTQAERRFLPGMRLDRLVYDCIDPCLVPEHEPIVDRQEFGIARKARMVFCTAESLRRRMAAVHSRVVLLPNACATDTCNIVLADTDMPDPLRGRKRPIIGCMGTYDWRIDTELLYKAAKLLPDCTLALIGRINGDQKTRMAPLLSLPNVVAPGEVPYDQGHSYCANFDIGIIPFLPGKMGDGINPVKMYMYLALGKPVISTWIAECVRHSEWVTPVRTPEAFARTVHQLLKENTPERIAARQAFAQRNSWEQRTEAAFNALHDGGLLDRKNRSQSLPSASPPSLDDRFRNERDGNCQNTSKR